MQRRSLLLSLVALGLLPAGARLAEAAQPMALSAADEQIVKRVEAYLNGLTTVQARFIQNGSDGSYAEGDVYIQRPGRMRFEYDPPVPLLIVADGYTLVLYDTELRQVTQVPTWDTPLWFLFKDTIKLADNLVLTRLQHGGGAVTVTIQEQQAQGNLSSVTLTFSETPLELRRWEVTDAKGVTVQTGLLNARYGAAIDQGLFDLKKLDVYGFQRPRNQR